MKQRKGIYDWQTLSDSKLLLTLSWPVFLSMLAQGLYNFVDSIYLSQLGEEVLSAVSLAYIVQDVTATVMIGIATGMNAIISRAIGAGDIDRAKSATVSGCVLQLGFAALVSITAAWTVPAYFQGSSTNETVVRLGIQYLQPCMFAASAVAMQITLERLLQSTGLSFHMMICQGCGLLVNVILDPIMIFGLCGFPVFGISGAAYATIAGQLTAALTAVVLNIRFNGILIDRIFTKKRLQWRIAGRICYEGLPVAALFLASNACNYVANRILIHFSSTANAAFGLYVKVETIALTANKAFQSGLLTALSFFYGQRNYPRIRSMLKTGFIFIVSWCTACAILFIVMPKQILAPFHPTAEMLRIGIPAMRTIGSTFLLCGYVSTMGAFYQSVGRSVVFLAITLSRQILVRIPAMLLLTKLGEAAYIWWAWPISEVLSDLLTVLIFIRLFRQLRNEMLMQDSLLPNTSCVP